MRSTLCVFVFLCFTAQASAQLDDKTPIIGLQLLDAVKAVDEWKEAGLPARLAPKKGLLITWVPPGSVADRNGIKEMDLLDKVNGKSVRDMGDVKTALTKSAPGELIPIVIRRQEGTGWHPIKGEILCSSPRLHAYAQMETTGSQVSGSVTVRHNALSVVGDLISPVIVISDGKPTLYLEVRAVGDDWLFMQSMTLKFDGQTVSVKLPDRDDDVAKQKPLCRERSIITMPDDVKKLMLSNSRQKLYRLDGKETYREDSLSGAWSEHVRTVIEVFEDMQKTGNVDVTLGGRIKSR